MSIKEEYNTTVLHLIHLRQEQRQAPTGCHQCLWGTQDPLPSVEVPKGKSDLFGRDACRRHHQILSKEERESEQTSFRIKTPDKTKKGVFSFFYKLFEKKPSGTEYREKKLMRIPKWIFHPPNKISSETVSHNDLNTGTAV